MPNDFGYTCGCGKFHSAGGWGAAHWTLKLTHTCDACGTVNVIQNGKILSSKKKWTKKHDNRKG